MCILEQIGFCYCPCKILFFNVRRYPVIETFIWVASLICVRYSLASSSLFRMLKEIKVGRIIFVIVHTHTYFQRLLSNMREKTDPFCRTVGPDRETSNTNKCFRYQEKACGAK